MLPFDKALKIVLDSAVRLGSEHINIVHAANRILAEADRQAQAVIDEADQRADAVVEAAEATRASLIEEARAGGGG